MVLTGHAGSKREDRGPRWKDREMGVMWGIPGEIEAGGSSIPPQAAFVKKACRAE
jgi:hypothetical protein